MEVLRVRRSSRVPSCARPKKATNEALTTPPWQAMTTVSPPWRSATDRSVVLTRWPGAPRRSPPSGLAAPRPGPRQGGTGRDSPDVLRRFPARCSPPLRAGPAPDGSTPPSPSIELLDEVLELAQVATFVGAVAVSGVLGEDRVPGVPV